MPACERKPSDQARRSAPDLRLRDLPARAGGDRRHAARRAQRAGGHAHGVGKVAVLSGAGTGEGRAVHRRLAAGGADAGPGGGPEARGCRGGEHQFVLQPRGQCLDLAQGGVGRGDAALSLARAPDDRAHDLGAAEARYPSDRHRRGALHLAMGGELPAGIRHAAEPEGCLSRAFPSAPSRRPPTR